jgi:hypothetical protein
MSRSVGITRKNLRDWRVAPRDSASMSGRSRPHRQDADTSSLRSRTLSHAGLSTQTNSGDAGKVTVSSRTRCMRGTKTGRRTSSSMSMKSSFMPDKLKCITFLKTCGNHHSASFAKVPVSVNSMSRT